MRADILLLQRHVRAYIFSILDGVKYLVASASVVEHITKLANAAIDEARAEERECCAGIARDAGSKHIMQLIMESADA